MIFKWWFQNHIVISYSLKSRKNHQMINWNHHLRKQYHQVRYHHLRSPSSFLFLLHIKYQIESLFLIYKYQALIIIIFKTIVNQRMKFNEYSKISTTQIFCSIPIIKTKAQMVWNWVVDRFRSRHFEEHLCKRMRMCIWPRK